jgi:hypothetical protein
MATHTREEMVPLPATITERRRDLRRENADQALATMPATPLPPGRRCEERVDYRHMCSYSMLQGVENKSVLIEEGMAFTLNRSTEGMLLLMGQAPRLRQMVEVRTPRARWSMTVTVFEAQWAKPVQVELLGNLYLVGCRRIFGPCHYMCF